MMLTLQSSVTAADPSKPDDPYFSRQPLAIRLGIAEAVRRSLDGAGVTIALIDSGLIGSHEDLHAGQILPGRNFTSVGSPLSTSDYSGHGTFIAGLIAARRGNGVGIAGLAPEARLLPLKCFDPNERAETAWIVQAIGQALDQRCRIINMSFGQTTADPSLLAILDEAERRGAILVAPVGDQPDSPRLYPASAKPVIGVGSLRQDGALSAFSQIDPSVLVTAPGEQLISLWFTAADDYRAGQTGTSFAAAYVTGLAALARQAWPDMTPVQFRLLLAVSASDLGKPGYDLSYGYGSLDIEAFFASMDRLRADPQAFDLDILRQQTQTVIGTSTTRRAPTATQTINESTSASGTLTTTTTQASPDIPSSTAIFASTMTVISMSSSATQTSPPAVPGLNPRWLAAIVAVILVVLYAALRKRR